MAKKSSNNIYVQLQKLTNSTQKELQKMVNASNAETLKYNTEEAKKSREWQTEMSNTSHQREVADLQKAGLNPVLSANQGAMSYTTSNASAQAENAANSVSQLTGAYMSNITGIKQSEIAAAAQKHAAATSAAATRAAAASNLAAAREAAAASRYAADKSFEGKKYQTDNSKSGNPWGILSNANFTGQIKGYSKWLSGSIKSAKGVIRNKESFMKSYAVKANEPFKPENLTFGGRVFVRSELKKANLPNNAKFFNTYVDAFLNNNKSAQKTWNNYVNSYYKSVNAATANVSSRFRRAGSGVW